MQDHVLAATEQMLIKADAPWIDKLAEAFGEDQVDAMAARPVGRGEPNTGLRKAYEARQSALRDWRAARGLD